ncbi:MAG: hypothetical protein Q8P61_00060 [Candidatus Nanopelagicales bacterium]|nr:hypothetical protein [Candidatus Nanopelagicales bacterium]
MRRAVLLAKISKAARERGAIWELRREGSNHSILVLDGEQIPVPRHNEINEMTAVGIMKQCEGALGERWWRQ